MKSIDKIVDEVLSKYSNADLGNREVRQMISDEIIEIMRDNYLDERAKQICGEDK